MIVMDETTSMVDVARFFMEFCMDESCGKCIPCRAGTVQMHGILERICQRRSDPRRPRHARRAVRHGPAARACAASARPPRTRCSARCDTSATSTLPTSRTHRCAGRSVPMRMNEGGRDERQHADASTAREVGAHRGPDDPRSRRARTAIDIPTLCHLDGLSDVGACRLCLVEVAGSNKLLPACVTARRRGHGGADRHRAPARVSPR